MITITKRSTSDRINLEDYPTKALPILGDILEEHGDIAGAVRADQERIGRALVRHDLRRQDQRPARHEDTASVEEDISRRDRWQADDNYYPEA